MPESYAGKINRKLLKKQRIIAAAAGREPADLVLQNATFVNVFSNELSDVYKRQVFNSSLIYETALLKPYVQPLLFGVPRSSDEYLEAKRLLKFLDYFLPVPADDVPQTSLMREFVGGGIYKT